MPFSSILFARAEDARETSELPDFFTDLHLDQVINAIVEGKQEYDLKPLFYTPLNDNDAIIYRHEVMRDLENNTLFEHIQLFAKRLRAMRKYLAQAEKLYYTYQKKRWFLDAVDLYCNAVSHLLNDLSQADLRSRGFLSFRDYVVNYVHSSRFTQLVAETKQLKVDLSTIKYCLRIKGNAITVRAYEGEIDYSADVAETFEKFRQGAVRDYNVKFPDWVEMNHVEAQIVELVARLNPEVFSRLDDYCARHKSYLDETIATFDREIQFYLAYLEYCAHIKGAGLSFCYPQLSATCKEIHAYETFDVALAFKLIQDNAPVVCNDFFLQGKERILVVSGPNQGGKTTFSRTFGQMHYLARLGCPVAGREAQLFLCDRLFVHFEKEEDITNLRGKLQDDLVRIHTILRQATANSIIILNEIFTSTTVNDALFLSKKVLEAILQLDALCVCVTFIDELASLSEKTVSMVSTVVPENPAVRTYKIIRKPADGLAYALAIAEKYHLTYDSIKERITA